MGVVNDMPLTYPVTGAVNDVDGSTALVGVTVRVRNVTKGEYMEGTTESDGSFSIDLYNFPTEPETNDKLQITAYTGKKSTELRHTVNLGVGAYDTGTINLHWTQAILGTARLFAGIFSNQDDSAEYYVELYDRENDDKIVPRIDINSNSSIPFNFGFKGLEFEGGICVIRENDGANTVEVCMVVK